MNDFESSLYSISNWISGKLWTIEDNKLVSNSDVWQSNHQWNLNETNPNETMVYIENKLTNKTLFVIGNNTTVTEKILAQNESKQMWKKGVPNHEGYFSLTYPESNKVQPKVLTATNVTSFEIKGNLKELNIQYSNLFAAFTTDQKWPLHFFISLIKIKHWVIKVCIFWGGSMSFFYIKNLAELLFFQLCALFWQGKWMQLIMDILDQCKVTIRFECRSWNSNL